MRTKTESTNSTGIFGIPARWNAAAEKEVAHSREKNYSLQTLAKPVFVLRSGSFIMGPLGDPLI
jgi:hypothetical protein